MLVANVLGDILLKTAPRTKMPGNVSVAPESTSLAIETVNRAIEQMKAVARYRTFLDR
jgi:hypothetical protein